MLEAIENALRLIKFVGKAEEASFVALQEVLGMPSEELSRCLIALAKCEFIEPSGDHRYRLHPVLLRLGAELRRFPTK